MLILLLVGLGFTIAAAIAFVQRQWRRGLVHLLISGLFIGGFIYVLLSWNAVMLKVQHDAATRTARQ